MSLTLEQYRLQGYTHVTCHCDWCCISVDLPISMMPMNARGQGLAKLSERLKCQRCGRGTKSVKPMRQEDGKGYARNMW